MNANFNARVLNLFEAERILASIEASVSFLIIDLDPFFAESKRDQLFNLLERWHGFLRFDPLLLPRGIRL